MWVLIVEGVFVRNCSVVFFSPLNSISRRFTIVVYICMVSSRSCGVGVSNLLASLGHTLNTQTLMKTDEQKKAFKRFYDFVLGHIHSHPGPHAA